MRYLSLYMRNARVWALLILAGPVAYQVAYTVDALHAYTGGPAAPFDADVATCEVRSPTPAATAAGLATGDILLTINGEPFRHPSQIYSCCRRVQAGSRLEVTYSRAGAPPQHASVVLAPAYPAMKS